MAAMGMPGDLEAGQAYLGSHRNRAAVGIWLKRFISAWHATIPLHHGIMAWHHGMDEGTNS